MLTVWLRALRSVWLAFFPTSMFVAFRELVSPVMAVPCDVIVSPCWFTVLCSDCNADESALVLTTDFSASRSLVLALVLSELLIWVMD